MYQGKKELKVQGELKMKLTELSSSLTKLMKTRKDMVKDRIYKGHLDDEIDSIREQITPLQIERTAYKAKIQCRTAKIELELDEAIHQVIKATLSESAYREVVKRAEAIRSAAKVVA